MTKGLEFDPGFGPHILAFQGTVEYLYNDINKFKNFSQRKTKFLQYHKKILEVFYNNIGFYIGCLMWAAYIKTQEEQKILNNHCFGGKFDEETNTLETDFMIKFVELFPRDMKYFLSESFEFPKYVPELLNIYKEFLNINKGFVETKNNTDTKLPTAVKTEEAEDFKSKIDEIIKTKDLSKFIELRYLVV